LAPEFRLPLLYLKERTISSALKAGDLPLAQHAMQHANTEMNEQNAGPVQGRLL
jgi:hypothetical protein